MIACTTWITLIHMQKKKNRIKPAIKKKKIQCAQDTCAAAA